MFERLLGLGEQPSAQETAQQMAEERGYKSWNEMVATIALSVKKRKKPPEGMSVEEANGIIEMDLKMFGDRTIMAKKAG